MDASRGSTNIRKSGAGQHELNIPFQRMLKSFRKSDPPPQPKLVLPITTLHEADRVSTPSTLKFQATLDLIKVATYFVLRVGGYIFPAKRTNISHTTIPDI